jgi:hypothetical protein
VVKSRQMTNTFYIAANILFDLETGKTTQVLLLATREEDATYFTEPDADTYLVFVRSRAERVSKNTVWSKQKTNQRTGMFVIQGVQNV